MILGISGWACGQGSSGLLGLTYVGTGLEGLYACFGGGAYVGLGLDCGGGFGLYAGFFCGGGLYAGGGGL